VSANLLLYRRPAPQQRAVPTSVARPLPAVSAEPDLTVAAPAHPLVVTRRRPAVTPPRPVVTAEPCFAARNSPVDLLFRGLWQLVGVYVYLVLVIKDRRLPRLSR
jgi:hypothetical protein